MSRRRDFDEQIPDDALLSGIALGDEDAILAFVRRYQRRLFGLALGIVGDVHSAEEAAPAWAALAQLPLEQRRCVVLAAVYGRTAADIALSESIPLGTAKSRLRLGMARLRDTVLKDAP